MGNYTITDYRPGLAGLWDSAVAASRNGTFILTRPYMDYHADRFADRSLLIADDSGRTVALFAAATAPDSDSVVAAHPGLTYGGLLPAMNLGGAAILEIMALVADHYRQQGYTALTVKPVPHIYHRQPADDDIYALWRLGATMSACRLSAAMRPADCLPPDTNTRRNIGRAEKNGIIVTESTDIDAFHAMLAQNLAERHNGATPVHTAAELRLLACRFPENIRLVTARNATDGDLLGGCLLFITDTCVHTQYIASTPRGRELRALPAVFSALIADCPRTWLDFGTSNEAGGHVLNEGLLRQKYGFGARGVVYPEFTLNL